MLFVDAVRRTSQFCFFLVVCLHLFSQQSPHVASGIRPSCMLYTAVVSVPRNIFASIRCLASDSGGVLHAVEKNGRAHLHVR